MKTKLRSLLLQLLLFTFCANGFAQITPPTNPVPASGEVNIFRDIWGVPHVYAADEFDGYFGAGYAQAEDNLEFILFRFTALNGKLAKNFGPDFVESDLFVKQYKILEDGLAAYNSLPSNLKTAYSSFISGIEEYMDDNPGDVPGWWTTQTDVTLSPELPTAYLYWLTLVLSLPGAVEDCARDGGVTVAFELNDLKFVDNTPVDAITNLAVASNEFVLMNDRTLGSAVYFANDPHVGFTAPRSEIRIHADTIQSSGVVIAGYPLPIIGHTENAIWGTTTGSPDVADCYEFEIDSGDSSKYLFDSVPVSFIQESFTIEVKDESSQTFDVDYVEKNGHEIPVRHKESGKAYVLASGDMGTAGSLDVTVTLLNLAQDIDDVSDAISNGFYVQNVMAADTNGETYYIRAGTTPIRPSGSYDWSKIVDGGTSATDWTGIHPYSDLVQVENPSAHYMQNNNTSPEFMLASGDLPSALSPTSYADYIYNGVGESTRGKRAVEMLQALTSNATVNDFGAIIYDEKWISASKWSDALSDAISNTPGWASKPADVQTAGSNITGFDGFASKGSTAALHFVLWLDEINNTAAAPGNIAEKVIDETALNSTEEGELITALEAAVTRMVSDYGSISLTYGDVHRIGRGGVLEPIGGGDATVGTVWSEQTIRAFRFTPNTTDPTRGDASYGQIHPIFAIVNISGEIESYSARSFGQQNVDSLSTHYSDQSELLSDKTVKPSYFDYDDLKLNLEGFITVTVP